MLPLRVLILAATCCGSLAGGGMVRRQKQESNEPLRSVLDDLLAHAPANRFLLIEGHLRPTFDALPKNAEGKVPLQAINNMMRSYFADEHGWLIKRFEFTSLESTKLEEALILQDKAPKLIQALREAEKSNQGAALSEAVAIAVAMENLVVDESMELLKGAYMLNGKSTLENLHRHDLQEVLTSFLIVFREGTHRNLTNVARHVAQKERVQAAQDDWKGMVTFVDVVLDRLGHDAPYSFEVAMAATRDLTLEYGKWQNSECLEMKETLMELQSSRSGRVDLDVFHSQPKHAHYTFTESEEYLRQSGSLEEGVDESSTHEYKHVLVANYLGGLSNCIASSTYYSVCCLNECEGLQLRLQRELKGSEVEPQQLVAAVSSLASSTEEAPRELPSTLVKGANAVAARYQGFVPLHSADFKQWLHYAYPNECAYPTAVEAAAEESERLAEEKWLGLNRVPDWVNKQAEEL